jgi:outer membrane protein OmpA-like peptidoglycan-associated protein
MCPAGHGGYLSNMTVDRRSSFLVVVLAMFGAIALPMSSRFVYAEEPSLADEILHALTPSATTRSLSVQSPEQAKFVDSLKKKSADSVAPEERQKLAALAKERPSFDVNINFDFNSDKIGPAAAQAIKEVSKALSNSQLSGNTFVIAGHTDAKGSDAYNQTLSERRAEAVRRALVQDYNIPAETLVAVGYGKTMLKKASNPLAPENRRVQIVNMADKNVATKQ